MAWAKSWWWLRAICSPPNAPCGTSDTWIFFTTAGDNRKPARGFPPGSPSDLSTDDLRSSCSALFLPLYTKVSKSFTFHQHFEENPASSGVDVPGVGWSDLFSCPGSRYSTQSGGFPDHRVGNQP